MIPTRAYYYSILISMVLCACDNNKTATNEINHSQLSSLLEQAGRQHYDPPVDGKLTKDQMEMYIAVKQREAELTKSSSTSINEQAERLKNANSGGLSDALTGIAATQEIARFATLDIQAAMELNFNTKEYEWVRDTLIETSANMILGDLNATNKSILSEMEKSLEEIQKIRDQTNDPELSKAYNAQISTMKQNIEHIKTEIATNSQRSESMRYNETLLRAYQDKIDVLESEFKKWNRLEEKS